MDTPQSILGLGPYPNELAIHAAYRRMAKLHHPDLGGDPAKFREIQRAYDALCGRGAAPPARDYVRPPMPETAAAPQTNWLKVLYGLAIGAAGVEFWLLGDSGSHYNGGDVLAGWLLVLMAWQVIAKRKEPIRNPLYDLIGGVGHAATVVFCMVRNIASAGILIFVIVGCLALAEKLFH